MKVVVHLGVCYALYLPDCWFRDCWFGIVCSYLVFFGVGWSDLGCLVWLGSSRVCTIVLLHQTREWLFQEFHTSKVLIHMYLWQNAFGFSSWGKFDSAMEYASSFIVQPITRKGQRVEMHLSLMLQCSGYGFSSDNRNRVPPETPQRGTLLRQSAQSNPKLRGFCISPGGQLVGQTLPGQE